MARWYWFDEDKSMTASPCHPPHSRPIAAAVEWIHPPIISDLHLSFARWTSAHMSPGPVIPHRLWIDQSGKIAVRFAANPPAPQSAVGRGRGPRPVARATVKVDGKPYCTCTRPHCLDASGVGRRTAVHLAIATASPTCPISTGQLGTSGPADWPPLFLMAPWQENGKAFANP